MRPASKKSVARLAYTALPLVLLLLGANPLLSSAQTQANTAPSSQYVDHGFAALAAGDKVTLASLEAATGDNLSVAAFENVIQSAFLPLNVREVLLDIGWENFTVGSPLYQTWVSNWLSASDTLGISNVLYVGQLTQEGFGSQWVNSLLSIDPSVATYYSNGTRAEFVSLDNPEVARYIESDLAILYSYYGAHPSWVGLGTGSSTSNPYYAQGGSMPTIGYSNLSISSFVNSPYYAADVNASGYLANGQLDALWSEYRNVQPSIVLSSGLWMTSSPYQVYGSGSKSSFVEMRFETPSSASTLQVGWYGNKVGDPGGLNVAVYADKSGALNSDEKLATQNTSASSFSTSAGWQNGIQVKGDFPAGWYWIVFSSPLSNSSDHYTLYMKDYLVNNATADAAQPALGQGLIKGSTILWIKNQAGVSLTIYPFQQAAVGAPEQPITATHAFSFNTVFLFLSDRAYNVANATLTITDTTAGGEVVATGVLSQSIVQGLENWVPIPLNGTVTAIPGHKYLLAIDDPSITWTTVMRYITTDPAQAGFQDQNATLLFELGNVVWSQGLRNWGGMTSNGGSAVTAGFMDALRFTPTANESFRSAQILMYSTQPTAQNYSSGTFSVAIWQSSADGSAPKGPPLQTLSVEATRVPQDGLLNISGFNVGVTAGKDYWVVFSANSTDRFTFGRLTSPFEFLVLVSGDGGASWFNPADGPTEFAFTVTLSRETLGTFVSGQVQTPLTTNSLFAQPFIATSKSSIEGIYLGPLTPGPKLLVSINPTGANGEPAVSPLGSGVYDAGNITLDYGPEFVQFSSVANLQKGEEYWIVIHPIDASYQITSLSYLNSAPSVPVNSSALVSNDNGLKWKAIGNTTTLISEYLLETAPASPPQYDTQTLFKDLSSNDNFSVSSGILQGWNAYIQASELSTFNEVAQWMSNMTGRGFEFDTNAQVNVVNQLALKDILLLPTMSPSLTCGAFLGQEESAMASESTQLSYAPLSLLEQCGPSGVSDLARQLNYVPYVGNSFGLSGSDKILVVGDQSAANLTGYLSDAFNTSYVNFAINPNLLIQGNISTFKAVLWVSSGDETISASVSNLLSRYVRGGGDFVTTDPLLANLSSLSSSIEVNGSRTSVLDGSSFLQAALVHTEYANNSFQETLTNTSLVAQSSNLVITARALGLGRVVFLGLGSSLIPQLSDQTAVISNILSFAAGTAPPFWFEASGFQTTSMVMYSVEGTSGNPLLVWIYNPTNSASEFTLDLNGSYYGLPSSWKTIQVPSLNATVGSGSNVRIQTTVPAATLIAVLVVPRSEPQISYSSALVLTQYTYPDQSLYSILGKYNQSIIVTISTNDSVGQVLLNDRTSLPQMSSAGQLYNATSGWFFDGQTGSLFVKYQSTGDDTLRLLPLVAPVSVPTAFPQQLVLTVFEVLILIEAITLTFLAFRATRRPKAQNADISGKT